MCRMGDKDMQRGLDVNPKPVEKWFITSPMIQPVKEIHSGSSLIDSAYFF